MVVSKVVSVPLSNLSLDGKTAKMIYIYIYLLFSILHLIKEYTLYDNKGIFTNAFCPRHGPFMLFLCIGGVRQTMYCGAES